MVGPGRLSVILKAKVGSSILSLTTI